VSLIRAAELEETIGGTDFHDAYDVNRDASRLLDSLQVHDAGTIVRSTARPAPDLPKAPRHTEGALHAWEVIHTFGSEELSAMSPPIAELAPKPYIEMHPEDAQARGYAEGAEVDLMKEVGARGLLRLSANLAKGTVAVPRLLVPAAVVIEAVNA
jgi:NADH-quinone oxidoreductase subunit G